MLEGKVEGWWRGVGGGGGGGGGDRERVTPPAFKDTSLNARFRAQNERSSLESSTNVYAEEEPLLSPRLPGRFRFEWRSGSMWFDVVRVQFFRKIHSSR